jgi:membrane associated rhomboid family serine protease
VTAVPWARPEIFLPLPAEAGPWGVARSDQGTVVFEQVADADALRRRVRDDPSVYYAWTPADRHIRPIYEIAEAAAEVEARGAEELSRDIRKSLPWLLGTIAALAAMVVYWPEDRQRQFIVLMLVFFLVLPMWRRGVEAGFEAWRGRRRLRRDPARWRALESSRVRFASWSGQWSSRVAVVLCAAFAVTFLATMWTDGKAVFARFALDGRKVRAGEWWRLLSCVFLHDGPMHLLFNGAAALSLAAIARSIVSEAYILGVFVLAGLAGSGASVLLSGAPSVGASGAILGWGGLLLGMALAHKELRPTGLISNLMRWIVVLTLIGVLGKGMIDNAAHAGGLVMGLAIGLSIGRGRLPAGRRLPKAAWVVVAALAAAPWLLMLYQIVR